MYSVADQWRLAFIGRAKRLGFTLAEIGDLLGPAQARSTGDIVDENPRTARDYR